MRDVILLLFMQRFCDETSFGEIYDKLHSNQIGVGLAINPDTELPQWSYKFVPLLDQIIIMVCCSGKIWSKIHRIYT